MSTIFKNAIKYAKFRFFNFGLRDYRDFYENLKVYDLKKVAPSNLGTKEMWKDAIIRNLSTEASKVVQKRNEEDVEEPEPKPKKRRSKK